MKRTTQICEGERPTSPRLTKPTPPSPPLPPPRAPPALSLPHDQPRLGPCTLTPPQATLVPCLRASSPGCPLFALLPPCCPPQANSFVCSLLFLSAPPCFAPVPLAPARLAHTCTHTCGQPLPAPCTPSLSACSAPECAPIRMHPTAQSNLVENASARVQAMEGGSSGPGAQRSAAGRMQVFGVAGCCCCSMYSTTSWVQLHRAGGLPFTTVGSCRRGRAAVQRSTAHPAGQCPHLTERPGCRQPICSCRRTPQEQRQGGRCLRQAVPAWRPQSAHNMTTCEAFPELGRPASPAGDSQRRPPCQLAQRRSAGRCASSAIAPSALAAQHSQAGGRSQTRRYGAVVLRP